MSTKILFLGATGWSLLWVAGYVGGTVLDGILSHPKASQFEITTYIRSADKGKKVEALGLGLKAVSGGFDAVEEAAAKADIIFNCASSDDVKLNEAVLRGAKKAFATTKVPVKIIHTSGSAIVADMAMGQFGIEKAVDDADEATLNALPITAFHRNVDMPLADAEKDGYVKAYVIAPPLIYGLASGRFVDAGLQNPVPTGILLSARVAIERGSFAQAGPAKNIWSTVEIHDIANLELQIFNSVLEGKTIASGSAYYTGVDGDIVMGDLFKEIAAALHANGKIKSPEPTELTQEEFGKWPVLVGFGVNSRMTDSRSRGLGWKPTHKSPQDFISGIKETVRVFAGQSEQFGGNWTPM
ncbi:hypothetical protein EIP91_012353 [Steccherinum ochraceum]|uniref:NmrA-like domain-containing protein n=1 Tax=Steccherinum ochraceum TaxID=92696 RepID=A0A4R0RK38_9APHY|nr:hypothetical protein EIP91_012353 [Steccherinum ochraceum]